MKFARMVALLFCATSVLVAASMAVGCASSPDRAEEKVLEGPPGIDAAEAYEAAARWLPAESVFVMSTAGEPMWEMMGDALLPTTNPEAAPGSAGTTEGLRNDLIAIMEEYLGFDLGRAEAIVVGANMMGGTAVILGDFDVRGDLPRTPAGSTEAYELEFEGFDGPLGDSLSIYMLPIDQPRKGVVLAVMPETLAQLVDGVDASLEDSVQGDEFAATIGATTGSTVSMAARLSDIPLLAMMEVPIPDWISFDYSYYENWIAASAQGDSDVLMAIEDHVEGWRASLRDLSADIDELSDEDTLVAELLQVYGAHSIEGVISQLEPHYVDGGKRLKYEVQYADGGLTAMWLMSIFVTFGGLWFLVGDDSPAAAPAAAQPATVLPEEPTERFDERDDPSNYDDGAPDPGELLDELERQGRYLEVERETAEEADREEAEENAAGDEPTDEMEE